MLNYLTIDLCFLKLEKKKTSIFLNQDVLYFQCIKLTADSAMWLTPQGTRYFYLENVFIVLTSLKGFALMLNDFKLEMYGEV